jgi:hypothetical protein
VELAEDGDSQVRDAADSNRDRPEGGDNLPSNPYEADPPPTKH